MWFRAYRVWRLGFAGSTGKFRVGRVLGLGFKGFRQVLG